MHVAFLCYSGVTGVYKNGILTIVSRDEDQMPGVSDLTFILLSCSNRISMRETPYN